MNTWHVLVRILSYLHSVPALLRCACPSGTSSASFYRKLKLGHMSSAAAASTPHVAFIAFPFASHPLTLFPIARAVAAAAPSAVVSFLATQRALSSLPSGGGDTPNLRYVAVADGIPTDAASPPPKDILHLIKLFLSSTPGNLKQGIAAAAEAAGGVPVSCISSDAFMWMSSDVAEELAVPWIPLRTGSTPAFSAHLHTDLLRQKFGVEGAGGCEEELLAFIPGLEVQRVRDLPEGIVAGDIDSPFSVLSYRMAQKIPEAAAVGLNTFEGLNPAIDASLASTFPRYLPIGPFHFLFPPSTVAADPNGCLPWLDRQAPASVVYVSFGSIFTPPPEELGELAEGLAASGAPFIWSLKEAAQQFLPAGFLARTAGQGMVVGWAPQREVLSHAMVGGFLTHSGWNSAIEGISAGVPMLCRPIFADQFMNQRSMALEWGNGTGFEGLAMSKEGVVRALDSLLKGEEGEKLRARAKELKEAAIAAVAPGGSSRDNFDTLLRLMLIK
ncbi:hypothetical protein ZIOFF_038142 [Zingiber officinale]|uniref:Glycosyltransferase n=2 Tax=Zingiber officinale TaxID=94328 RepID=A0A8J5GLF9_ZINOF|nr:hypothetical protein ZIOFF_038142 [Zingiber officinale]